MCCYLQDTECISKNMTADALIEFTLDGLDEIIKYHVKEII